MEDIPIANNLKYEKTNFKTKDGCEIILAYVNLDVMFKGLPAENIHENVRFILINADDFRDTEPFIYEDDNPLGWIREDIIIKGEFFKHRSIDIDTSSRGGSHAIEDIGDWIERMELIKRFVFDYNDGKVKLPRIMKL